MKISQVAVACFAVAFAASSAFTSEYSPEFMQAMTNGAKARIALKVVDDDGVSVPSVKVRVQMGMNFAVRSYWIDGETDKNGAFLIEGKTTGNKIAIGLSKDGYYDSRRELHFIRMGSEHEVKDGKWQPWGKEERIVLRKIRNPIELKRQTFREYRDVDIINEWVGFDLENNDFVASNRKGKYSDFEVRFVWDGKWLPDYTGMAVEIRFPLKESGGYWIKDSQESNFKGAYSADSNETYLKEFSFFEKTPKDGQRTFKHFDADKSLVVRSRCVFDEKGKLVSANYACIDRLGFSCAEKGVASLHVISVFNPTPNDANLEDVEVSRRQAVQHRRNAEYEERHSVRGNAE